MQLRMRLLVISFVGAAADTVEVGLSLEGISYGWTDGVCYRDIVAQLGDVLVFKSSGGHTLVDIGYQPAEGASGFCDANLQNAEELAGVGNFPYSYTISTKDVSAREKKFICTVGAHCRAGQRLRIIVVNERIGPLQSLATTFAGTDSCDAFRDSGETSNPSWAAHPSTCGPIESLPDGRKSRSCLSPPMTFHPGGVINEVRTLFYPYPHDEKVVLGDRVFEMVEFDTNAGKARSVPLTELYIHHLAGNMVFGQGSEGLGKVETEFSVENIRQVTGTEQDWMIFHLIDLRDVPLWLECVECRCYREGHTTGLQGVGGVDCCYNCTTATKWTQDDLRDYYMRYNVTWRKIDVEYVEAGMLTADISPAVGRTIEYDVPASASGLQSLSITKPFDEMFHHGFFQELYSGPDIVRIVRCVGHQHIAALGIWLYDAETNETLCESFPVYGTVAGVDEGMVTDLTREDFDPPRVVPRRRLVRLRTDYNATEQHTGVMGMLFLFYDSQYLVKPRPDASSRLLLDPCISDKCDVRALFGCPTESADDEKCGAQPCEDIIVSHPMCRFGGQCDCGDLIAEHGCGNVWSTSWGDVVVNDLCARSCNVCNATTSGDDSDAMSTTQKLLAEMGNLAEAHCSKLSIECQAWLSNLLACGDANIPLDAGWPAWLGGPGVEPRASELTDANRQAMAVGVEQLVKDYSNWLSFQVEEVKARTWRPCSSSMAPLVPPSAWSPSPPLPMQPHSHSKMDKAMLGGVVGGCIACLVISMFGLCICLRKKHGRGKKAGVAA